MLPLRCSCLYWIVQYQITSPEHKYYIELEVPLRKGEVDVLYKCMRNH